MSDRPTSGPAPRYGEYGPRVELPAPPAETPAPRAAAPAPLQHAPAAQAARRPRRWDQLLTVFLLGMGLYITLTSIPQMLKLGTVLDSVYQAAGYGRYTDDGTAAVIGIIVNVVQIVLLIAAFTIALPRLRHGRLAFWVPLTAGVVATIIVSVLIGIAMFSDPALLQYVNGELATPSPTP